jgi:hypothetical protein
MRFTEAFHYIPKRNYFAHNIFQHGNCIHTDLVDIAEVFVAAGTCLPNRSVPINVSSRSAFLAFDLLYYIPRKSTLVSCNFCSSICMTLQNLKPLEFKISRLVTPVSYAKIANDLLCPSEVTLEAEGASFK